MQAGPDLRGGPALEPQPCGAEANAQVQLIGVSLQRWRQGDDQLESLAEMRNRLGQGHALQCQLAGILPQRNGAFSTARSSQMMRQYLGFGSFDVRKLLLDHPGDLRMQFLAAALE